MCARYTFFPSLQELQSAFEIFDLPAELNPIYNIPPSTWAPIVLREPGTGRQLRLMRWGLVPTWATDASKGPINARAEEAASKPFFRAAMKRRRCLVPASGFFEWKTVDGKKQPYFYGPSDGPLFALAGLWEQRDGFDGVLETFAILTTSPNELLAEVHDRMPVIVPPDAYDEWLDPAQERSEPLRPLLAPYPAHLMRAYPVTPMMNNPRFNAPEAAMPVGEGPGALF